MARTRSPSGGLRAGEHLVVRLIERRCDNLFFFCSYFSAVRMILLAFRMGGLHAQRQIDPSSLEGEDLDRWYRRPFDEIEAEREAAWLARHEAFFATPHEEPSSDLTGTERPEISVQGQGVGWQEARVAVRPPNSAVRPGGGRVGVPSAVAGVPAGGPGGAFFDTHRAVPNPAFGPAYLTDLPRPLNRVTPRPGQWFELGDGTLVKGADEVERIHGEQQRRMRGEYEAEPAAQVSGADRFQDGVVPRADQLAKGQRERDATCHPFGGWELDPGFSTNPARSQRYETQITRAPGLDYVVRNPGERPVKFDGCAVWDPKRQLLEAKGPGYAGLADNGRRYPGFRGFQSESESQARRQAGAARGRPTEWHVAEPEAVPYFAGVLGPYPSISLRQTPAR